MEIINEIVIRRNIDTKESFESYVHMEDTDDCILWNGTVNASGYGVFFYNRTRIRAHRMSYILYIGKIPDDKPFICHECDNRLCVNPKHLKACDHNDNMKDTKKRGSRLFKDKHIRDGILKGKMNNLNLTFINKRI